MEFQDKNEKNIGQRKEKDLIVHCLLLLPAVESGLVDILVYSMFDVCVLLVTLKEYGSDIVYIY